MDIKKAEKALEQVARSHNKDVSVIKKEIVLAIAEAMRSDDPVAQAYWNSLLVDGRSPTAEELVAQLGTVLLLLK